jgi:hypothetical protein
LAIKLDIVMQATILPHAPPKESRTSEDCSYSAPEPFVDADEAAIFLSLPRRRILNLARTGKLPAHPIGDGTRRVWRFRLSEIAAAITSPQKFGLASRERAAMVRPQTRSGDSE